MIPSDVRWTYSILIYTLIHAAVRELFLSGARERRNGPSCRAMSAWSVSRPGKVHRFRKRSDFSRGCQGLDRRIEFLLARGISILIPTRTVPAVAARILIALQVLRADLHVLDVFLLAVGLRASHHDRHRRKPDVEGLGGMQERVQTRTGHRRVSCVHEAEDRCQFWCFHSGEDHRDRLAMRRRSTMRQQYFLKPEQFSWVIQRGTRRYLFMDNANSSVGTNVKFSLTNLSRFAVMAFSKRVNLNSACASRRPLSVLGKGQRRSAILVVFFSFIVLEFLEFRFDNFGMNLNGQLSYDLTMMKIDSDE